MDRSIAALTLAGIAVALAGCNAPDPNRTTKAPPGVSNPTAITQPLVTAGAPPAPPERGPVPAAANTIAPGTDASAAFAQPPGAVKQGDSNSPASQEAAAKAPDTAAADAAKQQVADETKPTAPASTDTARDAPENRPRHGELTKQGETTELPKAGQVNNHSSTALEKDSGR